MNFVPLDLGKYHKFTEGETVEVLYLTTVQSKKFHRQLLKCYDRQKDCIIVFPYYANLKLALDNVQLKTGDLLRITFTGELETKNGLAKTFKVEYAPLESAQDELNEKEKNIIRVYQNSVPF